MKIRAGFVSNSSSASFTVWEVVLPENLELNSADLKQIKKDMIEEGADPESVEDYETQVEDAFYELKKDGSFTTDCGIWDSDIVCQSLGDFFGRKGLIVSEHDDSECNRLVVVSAKDLKSRIKCLTAMATKVNKSHGKNHGKNG